MTPQREPMASSIDTWAAIDEERKALVKNLVHLDVRQWDTQSLCAEWRVRDVVGHLVFAANSGWKDFAVGLVKNKGNLDRVISDAAKAIGAAPPTELAQQFADTVGSRNLPPLVKSECELADIVCHGEDIRSPLGLHRDVPIPSLLVAAEFLKNDRGTGSPKRIKGLLLEATDAEWSTGEGQTVAGPLQSLILAMAGRGDALSELFGDGIAELQARIGAA